MYLKVNNLYFLKQFLKQETYCLSIFEISLKLYLESVLKIILKIKAYLKTYNVLSLFSIFLK